MEQLTIIPLATLKRQYAREVLRRCDGQKTQAAKLLGISRSTLYRILNNPHQVNVYRAVRQLERQFPNAGIR